MVGLFRKNLCLNHPGGSWYIAIRALRPSLAHENQGKAKKNLRTTHTFFCLIFSQIFRQVFDQFFLPVFFGLPGLRLSKPKGNNKNVEEKNDRIRFQKTKTFKRTETLIKLSYLWWFGGNVLKTSRTFSHFFRIFLNFFWMFGGRSKFSRFFRILFLNSLTFYDISGISYGNLIKKIQNINTMHEKSQNSECS